MNNKVVTHMAAMSAAMRMLLADDPLVKPADLLIGASNELTEPLIDMMMTHAAHGRTTFLALFHVEDDAALLERVMVVDGSTTKNRINIGGGKFVQRADGGFAILLLNRHDQYEYTFSRNGRRLQRRSVLGVSDRMTMELRGVQALLSKAQTPSCQVEALGASVSTC
ncbi:MAG TPA: hypothetical protein VF628_13320 [Allosphingosinicella sp.]|jgi:hypothetical protein